MRRVAFTLVALPLFAFGLSACLPTAPVTRTVTYSVAVDGAVVSDVNEFAAVAERVYSKPWGWRGAGIEFVRVPSGGDFTLVLANPRQVENYDPICSYLFSCQAGRYVVINDFRWAHGSIAWPGDLDWYRSMVINHETGHWLGLGHQNCGGPGQLAPVMQQQSIDMQGCVINPWPLKWEIASVS
jgi:hypothetical protein